MLPGAVAIAFLVSALAINTQSPLVSSRHDEHSYDPTAVQEWSLNKFPNPNATDHLVFETVYSLLQHWPNTRMRNGHTIVPGVIPKGTLLYHATTQKELPPGPEWVALDPEHSHFFGRDVPLGQFSQGCWHISLATTRPLKVVYFDGNSAAKLPYGPLDTQDLLAWGAPPPDNIWDEKQRIEDLCGWGKNVGVDGFVRMEMDFEVMLCDFNSGVSVASCVDVICSTDVPPFSTATPSMFEVLHAGSWHNHFPGETRIQLDLAGLISFYDTQLIPSLVAIRAGQERWDHRVRNISKDDFSAAKSRLEAFLVKPSGVSSEVDWKTLIQVIVDRFAGRLELTRHLLNSSTTDPNEILDLANKTQTQLRIMLTPYIQILTTPLDPPDKADLQWTIPTFKLCSTAHTYTVESELDSMTDSQKLLLQAVRGTTREICRVVTNMWAAGVYAGIDASLNTKESFDIGEVTQVWNKWAEDLNRLMAWLDWSVWVKCTPGCGPEEICYLPTWPVGFPRVVKATNEKVLFLSDPDRPYLERLSQRFDSPTTGTVIESLAKKSWDIIMPESNEWMRPQPRCIGRVV